jgi:dnd system-associated protein 4
MRRIQRDLRHDNLVKLLTSGESPVFKEIWRVMLFAAALGVHSGRRLTINRSDSGKAIPENYFSSPGWKGFLYLIGISETGDAACLRGTEEAQDSLVTMFEEYANQGLHLMSERIGNGASVLDDIAAMLLEYRAPKSSGPDVTDLI